MKRYFKTITALLILFGHVACKDKSPNETSPTQGDILSQESSSSETNISDVAANDRLIAFVPEGFIVFDKIFGDLNKDGLEDCVIPAL